MKAKYRIVEQIYPCGIFDIHKFEIASQEWKFWDGPYWSKGDALKQLKVHIHNKKKEEEWYAKKSIYLDENGDVIK